MAVNEDYVRERLSAYIAPRTPQTDAQADAFESAVEAQVAYEESLGDLAPDALPAGVSGFSIGNYTVNFDAGARSAADTQATIAPAAWAYLFNAGLLARPLPVARRL